MLEFRKSLKSDIKFLCWSSGLNCKSSALLYYVIVVQCSTIEVNISQSLGVYHRNLKTEFPINQLNPLWTNQGKQHTMGFRLGRILR